MSNPLEEWHSGTVIHWGDQYWESTSDGRLEPLILEDEQLLTRSDYIENGLQAEWAYQEDLARKKRRRATGSTLGIEIVKDMRLKERRCELEALAEQRFTMPYEDLVAYARNLGQAANQLSLDSEI